jgi:hypothetical protein
MVILVSNNWGRFKPEDKSAAAGRPGDSCSDAVRPTQAGAIARFPGLIIASIESAGVFVEGVMRFEGRILSCNKVVTDQFTRLGLEVA